MRRTIRVVSLSTSTTCRFARGCLYAVPFGSPASHGTIRRLDVSAARTASGVVCVLIAADVPGVNEIGNILPERTVARRWRSALPRSADRIDRRELGCSGRRGTGGRSRLKSTRGPLTPSSTHESLRLAATLIVPPRTFRIGDPAAGVLRLRACVCGSC